MAIYGRILRVPGVALLIAATTLTRIPFAINALAVILFLRETTGSFATAGLAAGALALGAGIGAPVAARVIDRHSAAMLLPLAVIHGAAILLLLGLGEAGAPGAALVASALVAGVAFPPSGSVLRSRWPELMGGDPELTRGAYAFDSVTIEISFVSGPLITAALVACRGRRRRCCSRPSWSSPAPHCSSGSSPAPAGARPHTKPAAASAPCERLRSG